jgi:hypothetical protein
MLYSLFSKLPYGGCSQEHTDTETIQNLKLHQDFGLFLHQQITAYAPGLCTVSHSDMPPLKCPGMQINAESKVKTPVLDDLSGMGLQAHDFLWFQIWLAMTELLKRQPNERYMSMGLVHLVFKQPQR